MRSAISGRKATKYEGSIIGGSARFAGIKVDRVVKDKNVVVLKVYQGYNTPYTIDNKAYKRMDTSTVQVDKYEYQDLILRGRNISYDSLPHDNPYIDLTFEYLGSRLREKLNVGVISEDVLKSLGLICKDRYTNAAVLLSDRNTIENSKIALLRFEGDSVRQIKDRAVLSGISLIEQFDRCIVFYNKHINISEMIDGAYRKTLEEVPLVAYREAIANAIVHRDYSRKGDVRVEIFDNQIEVTSPGSLPVGISKEEYLEGRISVPRNVLIADIFLRLGIIERLATGVRRIREYYKDTGVHPLFMISENTIKIVLPKIGIKDREISANEKQAKSLELLEGHEKTIIEYMVCNKNISRHKAEEILGLKKTQTVEILNSLQEKGLIARIGTGRGVKYILNESPRILVTSVMS